MVHYRSEQIIFPLIKVEVHRPIRVGYIFS